MIHNDKVYGKPLVQYTGTKTDIEALTGLGEGSTAYATDTDQFGSYNGLIWTWGQGIASTTHYEPIVFNDEILIFDHDVVMMEVAN